MRYLLPILAACLLCCSPAPAQQAPPSAAEIAELQAKAEKGDANAQYNLAIVYGNGFGIPKNDVEAVKWYRAAAEQGHAISQGCLGFIYREGILVPKDVVEAAKWLRKAAEQGNVVMQYELALMYSNGEGVPKDETQAYKWMLLASSQGLQPAKEYYEQIERRLTREQRAERQRMAREFKPVKSK